MFNNPIWTMSKTALICICVILAVAVVALLVKVMRTTPAQESGNAVIDNIMTRTSVRAYTSQPVDDTTVETMIRAAMAAPSAGNKQPWRFVVVTQGEILQQISDTLHTMRMAKDAPLAIVVCGDLNDTFPGEGLDYWVEDASAATENLLLAAHSLGLGAVWCGIYPMSERVEYLSRLLELPGNIVPLNVVPIGYPAESPAPKDKWKPENIHYNTWGNVKAL